MKRDWAVLLLLVLITTIIYRQAFFNFFAQDDFVLINYFSQNNLLVDIKNVFGYPTVTHWRPLHNLYFLVAGNIFGNNYLGYHLLTFLIHISVAWLIYKIIALLGKNKILGIVSALVYTVHPAHFVSLFWISGAATTIGFFILLASTYCYLVGKKNLSLTLLTLSLLASEAMIAGLVLFYAVGALKKEKLIWPDRFLIAAFSILGFFALIRFTILTPKTTFDTYAIEFSGKVILAIKYYILRITGFAETSNDLFLSVILLSWLILIVTLLAKSVAKKHNLTLLTFSLIAVVAGLFPFILIPSHLSGHYMNLSIFGFSFFVALALERLRTLERFLILLLFLGMSIYNVNLTINNNWVVKRSNLAKTYIQKIENNNLKSGSTIIFADSALSTSEEAYIALGTGKAIKFWFGDKNYQYCFSRFEICSNN